MAGCRLDREADGFEAANELADVLPHLLPSETETDMRPRPRELRDGTCDLARPDHAHRPLTLDDRQVMDGVVGHELERDRQRRGRDDRDRLARHPLPRARLARVNSTGERVAGGRVT